MQENTHHVLFNSALIKKPDGLNIKIGNIIIDQKESVTFLEIHIESKLDWHDHIINVRNKINSSCYAINKVKHLLNNKHLTTLYYSMVYPFMYYGITLWGSTHLSQLYPQKVSFPEQAIITTLMPYSRTSGFQNCLIFMKPILLN